jgi:hypothetical protein
MTKAIPFPRVEVEWVDAEADANWITEADLSSKVSEADKETNLCTTRGYEIARSKKWLIVASTLGYVESDHSWNFTTLMWIPMGMVRKVRSSKR